MDIFIEILIHGSIHSISLALIALGFALVYSTCRVPNFAHGALYVICGFITWSFLKNWGLNYFISILLSILVIGIIGALIYQFILIRVRGMAISEIIASYAIGLAILEGLRWGGFKGMTYTLPTFIQGTIFIAGVPVDLHRIVVLICGAALVGSLWLFTHYTRTGLALRGMAQDERAALMLGIDSDRMAVLAMGFGSMLAGLAAVLLLPLGNIVVEAGYNVLILAIAVCIVGGLGSSHFLVHFEKSTRHRVGHGIGVVPIGVSRLYSDHLLVLFHHRRHAIVHLLFANPYPLLRQPIHRNLHHIVAEQHQALGVDRHPVSPPGQLGVGRSQKGRV